MRLLTPFYKKPYQPEAFSDECDDETSAVYKKFSFDKDTPSVGGLRMSAM